MIYRTFREEDIDPFVKHCALVFPCPQADWSEWFRDHYTYDPDRNLKAMFMAEEDGRIISTVQVFSREMYLKGYPVTVGLIGDVTTLEEYRMRGINNRLMQMCIDFMVENNIATSLLYTGIHDYYAKLGWVTLPQRHIMVELSTVNHLPIEYELVPFTEEDLEKAEELYHISAKRYDGSLTRKNPRYWSEWVSYYLNKPMALKRDGKMVAWMDTKLYESNIEQFSPVQNEILFLGDYASQPGEDWFLPMMKEYTRLYSGPTKARIPAPLIPDYNGAFIEDRTIMYRLNKPFMLGNEQINTVGKLASVLSDTLFWQTDVY